MNCKNVIQEISNYIDGDLDARLRSEVESHLKGCKECQVIVDQTRLTVDIFCDSEMVALPEDVRDRLHVALRRMFSQPQR